MGKISPYSKWFKCKATIEIRPAHVHRLQNIFGYNNVRNNVECQVIMKFQEEIIHISIACYSTSQWTRVPVSYLSLSLFSSLDVKTRKFIQAMKAVCNTTK